MEAAGRRGFSMDGTETRPRRAIHRSSSSEHLLESAPCSHCTAADVDGEKASFPNLEKATLMESMREKVVMVASQERPSSSPTVVEEGCGGQGRGAPWSYVGHMFSNTVSSVGVASKEGDTSSREVEKVQDMEGKKGKQKKKWSWKPDPEKRWPVQGW